MNYDEMFSDELIKEYARVLYREGAGEAWQKKLSVILAAIRGAVIRETSVGNVSIEKDIEDGGLHCLTIR